LRASGAAATAAAAAAAAALGLNGHGLHGWEAEIIRLAGAFADRLVLASNPAVQACRRMRLPADYLYVQPRPQSRGDWSGFSR
jgi:hypothetical protein